MKNPLLLLCMLVAVVTASAQKKEKARNTMSFKETTWDFGTIQQGETVKHEFVFTNTGTTPIVITNVVRSCSCTLPEYVQTPVGPGQTGTITLGFDSNGKEGNFSKTVTVKTNLGDIELRFKGVVALPSN